MSHLVYVLAHTNYLLCSTCFLMNIILTIYVRNLTATLKLRNDIDRIDSNSNLIYYLNNILSINIEFELIIFNRNLKWIFVFDFEMKK